MKQSEYPSCLDKIFAQLGLAKSSTTQPVSPSGVSNNMIPFKPDRYTSEILRQSGIHHCVSRSLSRDVITLKSSVESDKCPSCQNDWTFLTQLLPLVTEITSLDVQGTYYYRVCECYILIPTIFFLVEMAICTNCNQAVPYDGGRDALINMTTCLVSHDLLRSYLHSFLNGRYVSKCDAACVQTISINHTGSLCMPFTKCYWPNMKTLMMSGFLRFSHTTFFVPLGITFWNFWMLIMKRHSSVRFAQKNQQQLYVMLQVWLSEEISCVTSHQMKMKPVLKIFWMDGKPPCTILLCSYIV